MSCHFSDQNRVEYGDHRQRIQANPRQRFEHIDDPDRIACQMPQPPVQDIVKHHRKQCGEPHVDYVFNIGVFAQRENYQRDQRQRDRRRSDDVDRKSVV